MAAMISSRISASGWPPGLSGIPQGAPQGASLRGGAFLPDSMGPTARQIIEIAPGADLTGDPGYWPWVDITSLALWEPGVSINPMGRQDEFNDSPAPAQCKFTVKNFTGDFTPFNAFSKWYPGIKLGVPVRVLLDMGNGASLRFQGEVSNGFAPRWDASRRYAVCDIEASGISRRHGQGTDPLRSPMTRGVSTQAQFFDANVAAIIRYWPMEDGTSSTSAVEFFGHESIVPFGTVTWASSAEAPGTAGIPAFANGAGFNQTLPVYTSPSPQQWRMQFVMQLQTTLSADTTIFSWKTEGGTYNNWRLQWVNASAVFQLQALDDAGVNHLSDPGGGVPLPGITFFIDVQTYQSGTSLYWSWDMASPSAGFGGGANNEAAQTLGRLRSLHLLTTAQTDNMLFGHMGALTSVDVDLSLGFPLFGVPGDYFYLLAFSGIEKPTERIRRICAEENVHIDVVGRSDIYLTLGAQEIDTFLNILKGCARADGGLLLDGMGPGYTYIARSAIEDRASSLTLNAAGGQVQYPLIPMPGDQGHVNKFTASRQHGSSVTARDVTSPMGSGPNGINEYSSSASYNFLNDNALYGRAQFEVGLGTANEARYPAIHVELAKAANATLRQAWLDMSPLSRIEISNLISVFGFSNDALSLLVQGYSEHFNSKLWSIALNNTPYAPWRVGQYVATTGDTNEFAMRFEAQSSDTAVSGEYPAGSTSIVMNVDPLGLGIRISTTADDMPCDVVLSGFKVHVTAVSAYSAGQQTLTVDATIGPIHAGSPMTLWRPAVLGLTQEAITLAF